MDDANFRLPADFLNHTTPLYGYGSSSNSNSDLSSPVESVMGSSDEDDYLDHLSRKLAQSTLDDGFWKTNPPNFTFQNHPYSYKSMLCGCKNPDCRSPPVKGSGESAWDVLYGEVARMRMAAEDGYYINRAPKTPNPNFQFHHLQAAAKLQQMKQHQQFLQQQTRNGGGWQQSQPAGIGSGMRAVFLGKPNAKRECSGTGVFLPRPPTEARKKRGCSSVLIPDRVAKALNLNLVGSQPPHRYDAEMMSYRKSVMMGRQQVDKDLRLPQEWTY